MWMDSTILIGKGSAFLAIGGVPLLLLLNFWNRFLTIAIVMPAKKEG